MEKSNKVVKVGMLSLPDMLEADNLEVINTNEDGSLRIKNKSTSSEFDLEDRNTYIQGYLKRHEPDTLEHMSKNGITLDNFDIVNNTKDTALDVSPISIFDRGAMSAGNMAGSKKYLASKFDEVDMNQNGDIVVRKGDTWHKVDAKGLGKGDAVDMLNEFGGDVADFFGDSIQLLPSLSAALATGGAGAAAGAVLGTGLKTAMGKALGTYEGDSVEMAKDIGVDVVMSLLGFGAGKYASALGSKAFSKIAKKPTPQAISEGLTGIGKEADEGVVDMLAGVLQFTANKSKQAMKHMLKNPIEVDNTLQRHLKNTKTYEEAVMNMSAENVEIGKEALKNGLKTLFNKAEVDRNLFINANKGQKINLQQAFDRLIGLEPVENAIDGTKEFRGLFQHPVFSRMMQYDTERGVASMISREEFGKLTNLTDIVEFEALYKGLGKFVETINKIKTPANANMEDLLDMRKTFDDLLFEGNLNPTIVKELRSFTQPFRDDLNKILYSQKDGDILRKRDEFLSKNSDLIMEGKRILNSDNIQAIDNYFKNLMAPMGTNEASKKFVDRLEEIGGDLLRGQFKQIRNNISASQVIELAPSMKNLQSGSGLIVGSATYAATQGASGAGIMSALAPIALTSPRGILRGAVGISKASDKMSKAIPNLYKAKEIIARLPIMEKTKLLRDPKSLGAIIGPALVDLEDIQNQPQE